MKEKVTSTKPTTQSTNPTGNVVKSNESKQIELKTKTSSSSLKGDELQVVKRPSSKLGKKNVGVFYGYACIVVFDDDGNWFWLNSATSDYSGEFDSTDGETALWFPTSGTWGSWSPTSGENFYLFRFDTWYSLAMPYVEEYSWQTSPGHIMVTTDLTLDAKSKSGKPRLQPSKAKSPYFENGKWRRPKTPKFMSKRVGDDTLIPVATFGLWNADDEGLHVMSTACGFYDADTEYYYIPNSPVAFSEYWPYYGMDIEDYTDYYAYTFETINSCSIGGAVNFSITGPATPGSLYPLGRQLQAAIPSEVTHTGIRCSGCRKNGIIGNRYKCLECKDFNLCSKCENAGVEPRSHSVNHNTLMIKVPRAVHVGVTCNKCKVSPIEGTRFKCQICDDFDMCETCERKNEHPFDHPLIKARKPLSE